MVLGRVLKISMNTSIHYWTARQAASFHTQDPCIIIPNHFTCEIKRQWVVFSGDTTAPNPGNAAPTTSSFLHICIASTNLQSFASTSPFKEDVLATLVVERPLAHLRGWNFHRTSWKLLRSAIAKNPINKFSQGPWQLWGVKRGGFRTPDNFSWTTCQEGQAIHDKGGQGSGSPHPLRTRKGWSAGLAPHPTKDSIIM